MEHPALNHHALTVIYLNMCYEPLLEMLLYILCVTTTFIVLSP